MARRETRAWDLPGCWRLEEKEALSGASVCAGEGLMVIGFSLPMHLPKETTRVRGRASMR